MISPTTFRTWPAFAWSGANGPLLLLLLLYFSERSLTHSQMALDMLFNALFFALGSSLIACELWLKSELRSVLKLLIVCSTIAESWFPLSFSLAFSIRFLFQNHLIKKLSSFNQPPTQPSDLLKNFCNWLPRFGNQARV